METGVVYPTEKSVLKDMRKYGIKKVKMFITFYVDPADGYAKFGYSVNNIDKGYYRQQNVLNPDTKIFKLK
jgi:hypothetical protein